MKNSASSKIYGRRVGKISLGMKTKSSQRSNDWRKTASLATIKRNWKRVRGEKVEMNWDSKTIHQNKRVKRMREGISNREIKKREGRRHWGNEEIHRMSWTARKVKRRII